MPLVDPDFSNAPSAISEVLRKAFGDEGPERLARGLYVGGWAFEDMIGRRRHLETTGWFVFDHDEYGPNAPFEERLAGGYVRRKFSTNEYGVCDSPEQFMDAIGNALDADTEREFVVTLNRIRRDEQSPQGGWRWHKWGPYIGKQERQGFEYLYDEKGIDEVWIYHIYNRPLEPRIT